MSNLVQRKRSAGGQLVYTSICWVLQQQGRPGEASRAGRRAWAAAAGGVGPAAQVRLKVGSGGMGWGVQGGGQEWG